MEAILSLIISLGFNIAFITAFYRKKKVKYRIVETSVSTVLYYSPQVRIDGVWFGLITFLDKAEPSLNSYSKFLDLHDAIVLIDKHKSEGNFTIPSNRKLSWNEKGTELE